ncbi:MAG TPA: cupredoxin domain-containing protein [bacterium]
MRRLTVVVIVVLVAALSAVGLAAATGPAVLGRWSSIFSRLPVVGGWFAPPAVAAAPVTVLILDGSFSPSKLTVRPGTAVRWVSRSQIQHTTTSFDGLWDSPSISRNQSFTFTFVKPGTYRYLCRQHLLQGMIATVTVK